MPSFRSNKKIIREWIQRTDWVKEIPLPAQLDASTEMEIINALFACLPQGDIMTQRAAYTIGLTISNLYKKNTEQAKVCIRRFMWHMNEESGNIGWGIPQAFGESLAQNAELAKVYHNVLISYVYNINSDSNYCDHAPLRVACYEGVYTMGLARKEYRERICTVLQASLEDDPACLEFMKRILNEFQCA